MIELPVTFKCEGNQLCGVVHVANEPTDKGVLIIVGGPQYRVGSHRQFTLLARCLAKNGITAMRFDFTGMGDSSGDKKSFSDVSADIASAIDLFIAKKPELKHIVIWGLCDAASAALLYAHKDERVKGLILLNPWVHTEAGEARAYLRHYYIKRLFNREFLRKLWDRKFDFAEALKSLTSNIASAFCGTKELKVSDSYGSERRNKESWLVGMLDGASMFGGKVLFILSADDMTAKEFSDLIKYDSAWRQCFRKNNYETRELSNADHTFSSHEWRSKVEKLTCDFVKAL